MQQFRMSGVQIYPVFLENAIFLDNQTIIYRYFSFQSCLHEKE